MSSVDTMIRVYTLVPMLSQRARWLVFLPSGVGYPNDKCPTQRGFWDCQLFDSLFVFALSLDFSLLLRWYSWHSQYESGNGVLGSEEDIDVYIFCYWQINFELSWVAWIGVQDPTNSAAHRTRWFPGHVLHQAVNNQDVIKMSDGHRNVVIRYKCVY